MTTGSLLMAARPRRILKALVTELRGVLQGRRQDGAHRRGGDLEQQLAALGLRHDRSAIPAAEVGSIDEPARQARRVIDRSLALREATGQCRGEAIDAYLAEAATCWANRLIALRCMEARDLIDEVILRRQIYGNRSLEHHRLAQRAPERCHGADDGLYAALDAAFDAQAERLGVLFERHVAAVALRPSPAALEHCVALLSGQRAVLGDEVATAEVFQAADVLGWAYQYWHGEEREHLLERLRTDRRAKVEGSAIVPATQLYTESYMVQFLAHNTLGAIWSAMHPGQSLADGLRWRVSDAPSPAVVPESVPQLSVMDPACGSGHFLLAAFDVLYAMHQAEGSRTDPQSICRQILQHQLYGIDVDARAVQIAEACLWLRAAERCGGFDGALPQLVSSDVQLPPVEALAELAAAPEPVQRAYRAVQVALGHAAELGSLLPGDAELAATARRDLSGLLGAADRDGPAQTDEAAALGRELDRGLRLLELLSRRYDVVLANPPYIDKRNLGPVLRECLRQRYPSARGNTFAAFIQRCVELSRVTLGMVTPQTFLFVQSYQALREGLMDATVVSVLAQLGSGAFADTAVDPALFVLHREPRPERRARVEGVYLDLLEPRDKATALAAAVEPSVSAPGDRPKRVKRRLEEFRAIPGAPWVFELGPASAACFAELPALQEHAEVVLGMKTSDNRRFVRAWWELCGSEGQLREQGWVPYEKRASGHRYGASAAHWVRWTPAAVDFYQSAYSAQLPNERYWFREGIVYGLVSQAFCAKHLPAGHMSDMAASSVSPHDGSRSWLLLGLLNSSVVRWWLGLLNPTVNFQPIDLQRLPVPEVDQATARSIRQQVEQAVEARRAWWATAPTDRAFLPPLAGDTGASGSSPAPESLQASVRASLLERLELDLRYLLARDEVDRLVRGCYQLPPEEVEQAWRRVGIPPCEHPLWTGLDRALQGARAPSDTHSRIALGDEQKVELCSALQRGGGRARSGRGRPAGVPRRTAPSASDDTVDLGEPAGVVAETPLGRLAHALTVHPLSAYRLVREGLLHEGWRWPGAEQDQAADALSVIVLRLLGHRWLGQVDEGAGQGEVIIQLTAGAGARCLGEQVRAALAERFPQASPQRLESECADLLGEPLDRWLARSFFRRHIRQFERRPTLWQLQSEPPSRRRAPAFSCLVSVARLDADTLPRLRSHHLLPLRRRLLQQSEQDSAAARRRGGEARRLAEQLRELEELDRRLERVIEVGFQCPLVDTTTEAEPLDSWSAPARGAAPPADERAWQAAEVGYHPNPHDGVRVNIAPLQHQGLLAAPVLQARDAERAIEDRARWRGEERRWCREGVLRQPSWWDHCQRDLARVALPEG